MTIQAVAWDIDGTLVDSEPVHLLALKTTCAEHGVDLSDLPDDRFIGVNMLEVWEVLGNRFPPGLPTADFLDDINCHYRANAHQLRPMPGALEAVSALSAAGLRQVAVSNSARIVVDANLALGGLGDVMEFSLGFDDVSAGKPDPEPYRNAATMLKLKPTQIAAVEDSETGAQSAAAAGLRLLRLQWQGGPAAPARGQFADLRQIADAITRMARPPLPKDRPDAETATGGTGVKSRNSPCGSGFSEVAGRLDPRVPLS